MRFFRFILALTIFLALLFFTGIEELTATLASIEPVWIFYLLALSVVMIWVSCVKWQLFIRAAGHEVGILFLMRLYTIAYFFNQFAPSYLGGDVARSYQLGTYLGTQQDAFVSTYFERFTGLLAMSVLGVLFVCFGSPVTAGIEIAIFIVAFGAFCIALVSFSQKFCLQMVKAVEQVFCQLGLAKSWDKCRPLFYSLQQAVEFGQKDRKLLLNALLLSFVFHVLTVVNTYVAARAVSWAEPSFSGLFVVVPLVLLVSMVPLTPSSLGIQEGAFLFFLERVGATRAQAMGVGLVLRAKVYLIALLGCLLWATLRKREAVSSEAI